MLKTGYTGNIESATLFSVLVAEVLHIFICLIAIA